MKDNTGEMKVVDWKDAIVTVAKVLDSTPADKMAAVVGGLADAEVYIRYCIRKNNFLKA